VWRRRRCSVPGGSRSRAAVGPGSWAFGSGSPSAAGSRSAAANSRTSPGRSRPVGASPAWS
jgi:hypothetical protein